MLKSICNERLKYPGRKQLKNAIKNRKKTVKNLEYMLGCLYS